MSEYSCYATCNALMYNIVINPQSMRSHMQVMNLAENDKVGEHYGVVTIDDMSRELGWDEDRSNRALELLLGKGMVWLDDNCGQKKYWFLVM